MPVVGTGRLSFISATPGGRSLQYQGCLWISGMVIRLAGSGTRMCESRSRHSLETFTCAGNSYSTFSILCKQQPARQRQLATYTIEHWQCHRCPSRASPGDGTQAHSDAAAEDGKSDHQRWRFPEWGSAAGVHLDHLLQLLVVMLVLWPLKGVCSNQHHIHHDPT